jgi:hypothetical protein
MEYEYLKLHTQDEFDSMPEDIYYDYEESITELADDLGIDNSVIKKTEEKLVNIAELLKKGPSAKMGRKFNQLSKGEQKAINSASKHIEKCREALISIIDGFVGSGELKFPKTVKGIDDRGDEVSFNIIHRQKFIDDIEEYMPNGRDNGYEALSCEMEDNSDEEYCQLRYLSLETLVQLIDQITHDKPTIYSETECFISNNDRDKLISLFNYSGLLEHDIKK